MKHANNYDEYKNKLSGLAFRIEETGDIFETRTELARFLGVSPGMVTMCLNGQVKNCKGYHIELVEEEISHPLTDDIVNYLNRYVGFYMEWREHPTRPDVYVSDYGLVAKNVRGRIELRKQHLQNSGYLVVSVGDYRTRENKNSNQLVHRLVAETFIPNYFDKPYVNHIDGDKMNNQVENLEWSTRSENMIHAYSHGLCKTENVIVKETGEFFRSSSDCARAINGTVSGIHDCKTGRQKQHRGYHFIFPEPDEDGFIDFKGLGVEQLLGLWVTDTWTGCETYFDDIPEAMRMLNLTRHEIEACLSGELEKADHYYIEPAGREEVLLYGGDNENNKFLSWVQFGIF